MLGGGGRCEPMHTAHETKRPVRVLNKPKAQTYAINSIFQGRIQCATAVQRRHDMRLEAKGTRTLP